jgi:tetratricopeptide (TPR) repeat protein
VSGDEYDQTLAGAWSLAAERANSLAPAGLARPTLDLAAVLDPNGIPETVLTSRSVCGHLAGVRPADGAWASGVRAAAVSVADGRRALRNLHRLSLVAHDPNDVVRSVRMHALAQRSTVESLSDDAVAELVRVAADALVESWPEVEREPGLGQVMRANSAALRGRDARTLWDPAAHPVLFQAGRSLGEAGLVADAIAYFEGLCGDCRRLLGPDHPDTLTARYDLAYWRGEAGDFAGAAEALEQLLADRVRVLGADHSDTLGTGHGVAYWRGHAGDPAGAAVATEALLTESMRVLGPDHPTNLSARHNLAHWRGQAGDPAAAVTAYEQLLTDQSRFLGKDHIDTLDTRRNLADWRGRAGNPAGAVAALEELLTDYTRVLGPDHPHTLHARENLAHWRGEGGDPAGAVAALEQLLTDQLRVLGIDHPQILSTRRYLAELQGQADDAIAVDRQSPE